MALQIELLRLKYLQHQLLAVDARLLNELVEPLDLVYLKLPPDYLLRMRVREEPARAGPGLPEINYLPVLVEEELLVAPYRD